MSDVAPAASAIPLEHARSHAGVPTAALVGTSLWVGSAALACGLLLLRRQTARGPPHPFVSAGVSGLLIGTGCLVVLPEALDSLPAAGWTSAQVLLLFLSAAALMFFLDHAAMEHVHVLAGERVLAGELDTVKPSPLDVPAESLAPAAARQGSAGVSSPTARETPAAGCSPIVVPAAPPTAKVMLRGGAEGEETGSDSSSEVETEKPQSSAQPPPPQLAQLAQPDAPPTAPPGTVHAPGTTWCPCHGFGGEDPFAKPGGGFSFFSPVHPNPNPHPNP